MRINYLYLDDENQQKVQPTIEMLKRKEPSLNIQYGFPEEFSVQIKEIKKHAFDGLILDLRLDQLSNDAKKKAGYGAYSLAQELRVRATDGRINDVPIMLCSSELNIQKSYNKENSSHDLFDDLYLKDDFADHSDLIAKKLVSLAVGYKNITEVSEGKAKNLHKVLGLTDGEAHGLDSRIFSRFGESTSKFPTHLYAMFILKELIKSPGPLLDDAFVCARLGVDITGSPDWDKLKRKMASSAYTGPFSDAWPRWWWFKVENWWNTLADCPGKLRNLSAAKRVEFLRKSTKLAGLQAAAPIGENYNDSYWTICFALKRPLNPLDGFIIAGDDPKPWQEKQYISLKAAVERTGYTEGIKVNPVEFERFQKYKDAMKNARGKKG